VVLTPHLGWPTDRKYAQFAEAAADVLIAWLDGRDVAALRGARSPMSADAVLEAYVRGKDGNSARRRCARVRGRCAAHRPQRDGSRRVPRRHRRTRCDRRRAVDPVRQALRERAHVLPRATAPEATDVLVRLARRMTGRDDGSVRVGSGRYDWTLAAAPRVVRASS
jgi:hypothetical protein